MREQLRKQEALLRPELSLTARAVSLAGPLLLCFIVLARVPLRHSAGGLGHIVLPEELVLALGSAVIAALAAWAGLSLRRDRVLTALAVLGLLEMASVAFAPNGWLALRSSGLLLAGAALFLAARAASTDQSSVERLAPLLVPLALVAASMLLEGLGLLPGLSRPGHAPGGLLGERNLAGQFLIIGAPLIAALSVTADRRWLRATACAAGGLVACACVLTRTRSVWLAALGLAAVGVWLATRTPDGSVRARSVPLLICVVLGISAALQLPTKLNWSSAHPFQDTLHHLVDPTSSSGAGRLAQDRTTLSMSLSHPILGVGPGNWAGQYPSFARPGDPTLRSGFWPTNRVPNSDFLGFLAERGVFAMAALVMLVLTLLRNDGQLSMLRRTTLLALLVVGMFDAVLQLPAPLGLAGWILGAKAVAPVAAPELRAPRQLWAGLAIALVISAALAAARLTSFSLVAKARGIEDLERAATLDPGDVALRLTLAEDWIQDHRCDRAQPHLAAARRYTPASPAVAQLDIACMLEPRSP